MRFSQKAKIALVHLFRPYNDIDIYVEDTTIHRIYEALIQRMLPEEVSLRRIFQLPGREAVLSACINHINKYGRKTLFIIDGDFNVLLSTEDFSAYSNLYQLQVFCIENLLISQNSLVEIAADSLPNTKFEDTESIIDYDAFISDVVSNLSPLIVIYYVAHILDKSIDTFNLNVNNFFKEEFTQISLDMNKIQIRVNEIKGNLLKNYPSEIIQEEMNKVSRIIPEKPQEIIKLICGRRYLIPLVFHHLHRKANYSSTYNQLKARLARHCDLNIDPGLQVALIETLRN